MESIINVLVNNGVALGMLVWFIYRESRWTDTINKSLSSISDSLEVIRDKVVKK